MHVIPFAYNLVLLLLSPALALLLARRLLAGKSREGWSERLGRAPDSIGPERGRRAWVHVASVGEFMAATPVLKAYRERRPDDQIIVSVITPGGHEVASAQKGKLVSEVFYCPFDAPFAVRRAMRRVRPDLFVVLETELWPNLLHQARQSGARVLLVNARISDRSLGRYRRLRPLFRWVLANFHALLAQSERDACRLVEIGAPPERVRVLGNAKFDQAPDALAPAAARALRAELRMAEAAPVLVVGSTRSADEEALVLDAYREAARVVAGLALIHAPRHVERAEEVMGLMRERGLEPVRRTALAAATGPVRHLVLDTFGELERVYALADVAYLGNSLLPPGGGQNLLQALAQGKPALYGPYMANFRDIAALAESAGVGFRVADAGELARRIVEMVSDAPGREELASRAQAMVRAHRGAAGRYADVMAGEEGGAPC